MSTKQSVDVYSAGCPGCTEAIEVVEGLACPSCEVRVFDMHDEAVASRAKELGVQRVPAVVIDGQLAGCCTDGGLDEASLRAAGLGVSRA